MEIYFYESELDLPDSINIYYGWKETEEAINKGINPIHTVQMGLLSTNLFEKGYEIFVGENYEIRLGQNDCTGREIRMGNSLFNLWRAGEFSKPANVFEESEDRKKLSSIKEYGVAYLFNSGFGAYEKKIKLF